MTLGQERIFVIAEAGVNHNGSLDMARRMIDVAADAGADAVKFQTFRAEKLVTADVPKAEYQAKSSDTDEGQLAMLKRLELGETTHHELLAHCVERNIQFLSTPFDEDSIDFLSAGLDLPLLKIGSGEITNAPLLLHAARTGKPLIVSTGMSTLEEIQGALSVLAFGYTDSIGQPSLAGFAKAFEDEVGKKALRAKVTLLQCTTEYPAPADEVNLRVMETLRDVFGLRVGLSDHTEGILVAIAAAAREAAVIEKHFTLDPTLPGPDHAASLAPDQLRAMVAGVRLTEAALGSPHKKPVPCELANREITRRQIVARRPIRKGHPLTAEDIAVKRAGAGLDPMQYWEILGKPVNRDYCSDEGIDSEMCGQ